MSNNPYAQLPNVKTDGTLYLRRWKLSVLSTTFTTAGVGLAGRPMEGVPNEATKSTPLVITTETEGFDLRMHFSIKQGDSETPNTAVITVYNLADKHAREIVKEYDMVILEAGYVNGNYGTIFAGQIKQYKLGRESAIDTYLIIYASEGDVAYNKSTTLAVLPAQNTAQQRLDLIMQAFPQADPRLRLGKMPKSGPGVLPRPRVFWGSAADEMRGWAKTYGMAWSIQKEVLQVHDQQQYSNDEIVILTAATGLVGIPESTDNGIIMQCLINPRIGVRGRVWLNNASINTYFLPGGNQPSTGLGAQFPGFKSLARYATTADDGVYTVFVINIEGDSRGLPWYMTLECYATDRTAPVVDAIQGIPVDPMVPGTDSGTPSPPL